jgi:Fic family protein
MADDFEERHSVHTDVDLIVDEDQKARAEARNALRQFDKVVDYVEFWLSEKERAFSLRPSTILDLHRYALEGINANAGVWRPGGVEIRGSKHAPVQPYMVPKLIEDLCDYINENWQNKSPVHIAAYSMWRINWIHPFVDGNGRTARALSYMLLCLRLGYLLPGTKTIPDQISEDKNPYYKALESADEHFRNNKIDVSQLELMISDMLAAQLVELHNMAMSNTPHK